MQVVTFEGQDLNRVRERLGFPRLSKESEDENLEANLDSFVGNNGG